jgi:hypothetical protein
LAKFLLERLSQSQLGSLFGNCAAHDQPTFPSSLSADRLSEGNVPELDVSLSECWRRRRLPLIAAIYYADGRAVPMLVREIPQPSGQFAFEVSPGDATAIARLSAASEGYGHMTMLVEPAVDPQRNLSAYCGEGSMGGDGYVALVSTDSDEPIWIAFFDASNPFVSVELNANHVIATSNHGIRWSFPIEAPEKVTVRS